MKAYFRRSNLEGLAGRGLCLWRMDLQQSLLDNMELSLHVSPVCSDTESGVVSMLLLTELGKSLERFFSLSLSMGCSSSMIVSPKNRNYQEKVN